MIKKCPIHILNLEEQDQSRLSLIIQKQNLKKRRNRKKYEKMKKKNQNKKSKQKRDKMEIEESSSVYSSVDAPSDEEYVPNFSQVQQAPSQSSPSPKSPFKHLLSSR